MSARASGAPLIYRVHCQAPLFIDRDGEGADSRSAVKAASRRLPRWPSASLDRLRASPQLVAVINDCCWRGSGRCRHLFFLDGIAHGGIELNEHFAHDGYQDYLARLAASTQAIAESP